MVSLVGIHITKAHRWPIRLPEHSSKVIKFQTCNRCQILAENDDVEDVVRLFDGHSAVEVFKNRECIRKLFEIANGSDSIARGYPMIRKQMIQSRTTSGTPKLKRIVSDVVHITNRMYPPEPPKYIDACKQFLNQLGFYNVKVITKENQHNINSYWCDAAIVYAYQPTLIDNHFKFYMSTPSFNGSVDSSYTDLTPLFRWSRIQPIDDVHPIADLYYEKMTLIDSKRTLSRALVNHGLGTKEVEHLFSASDIAAREGSYFL
jgi:hypothetical protein